MIELSTVCNKTVIIIIIIMRCNNTLTTDACLQLSPSGEVNMAYVPTSTSASGVTLPQSTLSSNQPYQPPVTLPSVFVSNRLVHDTLSLISCGFAHMRRHYILRCIRHSGLCHIIGRQ